MSLPALLWQLLTVPHLPLPVAAPSADGRDPCSLKISILAEDLGSLGQQQQGQSQDPTLRTVLRTGRARKAIVQTPGDQGREKGCALSPPASSTFTNF